MIKRLNVLILVVFLLGQTIIGPIGSTAGLVSAAEQDGQGDEKQDETVKVDKDALKAALADVENYDEADYEADSYVTFVEAVTAGEDVVENEEATQDEVDNAVTVIEKAIDALQKQTTPEDDEGAVEEDRENDIEVTEEQKDVEKKDTKTDKNQVEKEERQTIELFHHDGHEEFHVKISEVVDREGNPYTEDNPLGIDDEFTVKLQWELENDHNYKPGDHKVIQLPKEIDIPTMLEGELKDGTSGEIIANYTINTDGTVKLEFTDFVEEASNITGWVEVFAKLDPDNVENDGGNVSISPIEDEGGISLPLDQSKIEKTTEKQGEPNRAYNADEIEWTVTINKNALFLEDAKLTDLLPEGTEYIDGSLEIEKYPATINGTPNKGESESVTGITPSPEGDKLTIPLGDINDVYVIKYKTKVTDDEVKNFNNKVTLTDEKLNDTSANASVTIDRGEPLKKGTVKDYDPKTGIIEWYLEFNYDQKQLDNVTLADNWKPAGKVELVEGSVSFQEVEIDENGDAHAVGEALDPSEVGTLEKKNDGFEVSGITTDKPYKVVYQTKVTERELDGFRMENLATFGDHEYGEGYNIGQYVGEKSAGKIDYAEKTIEWTIKVNMDERQMNDVIIKDTLGDGLTLIEDSIYMTIGGAQYTDFKVADENPFTLSNIGNTDKEIIVTYKTNYDPNELPEDYKAYNTANISWIPEGSNDRIDRDVNTNTKVNEETINESWKDASYNPDTKEITWTIIANYRENLYEDFKILDEPQQNQKLVEDSIEVYELTIHADGSYTEDGDQLDIDPTVTNNSFTLDIGETKRAYKITYKTTLEGLDKIHQLYENKATVLDGDEKLAELDASAQVYHDTKYGNKTGKQQGKKLNWAVEVNNAQQVINDLVFKDMIDSESQEYLEDTITVYEATVKKDGTLEKGDKFDTTNYELTVEEDEFTIAWNDQVDRAFIVEYSTLFFAKDGEEVKNNYKITGDSIEEDAEDAESGASIAVRQSDAGGSGESGYLTVEKLDTTYDQNVSPLEGITFQVIDKETNEVLKTATTDADGHAEFGRLLFGTYTLKEVNTPEGYVGFGEQEIEIDQIYDPSVEETYMFEVENYKRNGDVELLKSDEEGNTLEGAEFTLFTESGGEIETKTTDKDGKIIFEDLEPGNYYVQETEAPKGYLLDETKHEVEIAEEQKEPIQLEVENKIDYKTYTTEVPVEKVWQGEAAESVEVTLFADGEEDKTVEITAEDDWKHTFTDLLKYTADGEEIEYTVEESLEGYKTEITGDQEEGFVITNTRTGETDISVEKVWQGSEEDSVTINLLADGEGTETVDLSDENNWSYTFEKLAVFDEEGQPIEYTVEEVEVDGYTSEITGDAEDGFTVTNTRTGETEVAVEKVWEDKDNKHELRPDSITVNLIANGEATDETVELSTANDWQHTFAKLDKFDSKGELIEYTVEEVEVAEYTTEITGDQDEGYTITNKVKDYAIGDYVWVDRNKDGIQDDNEEPLEGVKVELYDKDGNKIAETETDENGRYIFDELPAGEYKVKFTLTEEQAEKYRFTKEQAGDDTTVDSDADEETGWTREIILNDDNEFLTKDYDDQEFNATEGIDPTWDAGVIELVQIPVEKVWIDNDNAEESRPEVITVNVVVDEEVVMTTDITAEDGWAHIFKGLDKYDENGEEIVYTIEEVAVENYIGEIEETDEEFVITNTLTKDITPIIPITKVDVEKVWEGKALDEVTIILLADGEEVNRITLSDANNWKHTFNSLPKFSDSEFEQLIEYTVEEIEVEGYKTTITGDMDTGFVVTNTEIIEEPEKEDEDKGGLLPKTATQTFLYIALGLGLLGLGIVFLVTRGRNEA